MYEHVSSVGGYKRFSGRRQRNKIFTRWLNLDIIDRSLGLDACFTCKMHLYSTKSFILSARSMKVAYNSISALLNLLQRLLELTLNLSGIFFLLSKNLY